MGCDRLLFSTAAAAITPAPALLRCYHPPHSHVVSLIATVPPPPPDASSATAADEVLARPIRGVPVIDGGDGGDASPVDDGLELLLCYLR